MTSRLPLEGQLRPGQAVEAVGVVLVKNGNLFQPQVVDQMPDGGTGLLLIGGAHVNQEAAEGFT
jgi:hypothetical protein